eukprot:tig00020902_g15038.t1
MVGSIYIVRHGERVDYVNAVWNDDADFPYDPPLSDDGVRHAEELGRRLARRVYKAGPNGQIDLILVSPFWRTLQTASGLNMWVHAPMEAFSGVCEHVSKSYFHEQPELEYNSLPASVVEENFFKVRYKGRVETSKYPESHDQMVKRARESAKYITQEYCIKKNMNVLVVTHAAVMQEMVRALVGERDYDAKIVSEGAVGYCASAKLVMEARTGWTIDYSDLVLTPPPADYHRGEKRRVLAHVYSYMQDRVMEIFKGNLVQKHKSEGEKGREARTERLRDRLEPTRQGFHVGGVPVPPPEMLREGGPRGDDEYFNRQSPRPLRQRDVYIDDGGDPMPTRSPRLGSRGPSPAAMPYPGPDQPHQPPAYPPRGPGLRPSPYPAAMDDEYGPPANFNPERRQTPIRHKPIYAYDLDEGEGDTNGYSNGNGYGRPPPPQDGYGGYGGRGQDGYGGGPPNGFADGDGYDPPMVSRRSFSQPQPRY